MNRGRTGRYPFDFFSCEDLGPTERHRHGVFLRDDYRCLVARSTYARAVKCGGGLALHRAVRDTDPNAEVGPLLLRTFCTAHDVLAAVSERFRQACEVLGWEVPANADPDQWAARVPVRYPHGWWQLDAWGERFPLDRHDVARAHRLLAIDIGALP